MANTTKDFQDRPVALGNTVRVLGLTPDPDLDDEHLDMFMDMVGAKCAVERIDADGTAWVAMWWNGDEGTQLTLLGLSPTQMELQPD
jgi:hypothetical protein